MTDMRLTKINCLINDCVSSCTVYGSLNLNRSDRSDFWNLANTDG